MPSFPLPHRVVNTHHYHHPAGSHPNPLLLTAEMEMVELVTSGEGAVEHNGKWIDVQAGTLLWHSPGDHTIGRSNFTDPYRCLAISFRTDRHPGGRRVPRFSRWEQLDDVRDFTRRVIRAHVDESFDRAALLAYAYGQIRYQVERWHHGTLDPKAPRNLARVLELIEQDYATPLEISDLASVAGWSSSHLHATFREHVGVSPHQALIQRRLRAARERLTATDAPVKQIAVDCGFRDAAALCRTFRQMTGITPAAYRRRHAQHPKLDQLT